MKKRMMSLLSVAVFMAFMGFSGIMFAGDLEPSAPPDTATGKGTMKTLDVIPPTWSQKLSAAERFELVLYGAAVLDKETGLVWEASPSADNSFLITNAASYCEQKEVGGRRGWHLPSVMQLASLVDPTQSYPALPSGYGDFFSNVAAPSDGGGYYFTNTPGNNDSYLMVVEFSTGAVESVYISRVLSYMWCVRGGQVVEGWNN